ncbi:MAG: hypothetical protein ACE5I1_09570 [bacterium]
MIANNIFWNFGAGSDFPSIAAQDFVQAHLANANNNNRLVDPKLRGISRTTDSGLYPLPAEGSPELTGAATPADAFFRQTAISARLATRTGQRTGRFFRTAGCSTPRWAAHRA